MLVKWGPGRHYLTEATSYCCQYIFVIYSLRENGYIIIQKIVSNIHCVSLCIYAQFCLCSYVGKTCLCASCANKILQFLLCISLSGSVIFNPMYGPVGCIYTL